MRPAARNFAGRRGSGYLRNKVLDDIYLPSKKIQIVFQVLLFPNWRKILQFLQLCRSKKKKKLIQEFRFGSVKNAYQDVNDFKTEAR